MHLSKRVVGAFLTLAIGLLITAVWPVSPSELVFDQYELSSSSEFIPALDKTASFDFSHLSLIEESSLQVYTSPSVTSQTLGAVVAGGYDYQSQIFNYVVQSGDTVSGLAERFGISADTISWANDLNRNHTLKEGDSLIILPVSGALHLVGKNETLSHIARAYKVSEAAILSFNQISDANEIYIGDVLIIPGGKQLTTPQISTQSTVASSYFIRPTSGRITQGLHHYNAIDIANQCGTPIYAAAAGTVQRAGYISIGGNRVQILHPNGVVTYYGHLSEIWVKAGQSVAQGQQIGRMGTTGRSTGCHLHFDVRGATNPLARYSVGTYLSF